MIRPRRCPVRAGIVLFILSAAGALWSPVLAQGAPSAQDRARVLRGSAAEVATHWARGSASGLSNLLSSRGIGFYTPTEGQATLDPRKAMAALDDLLNRNSSVSCTVVRVTLASGASDRGSAELAWESMAPGTSEVIRRTVFVGFDWEGDRWRIYEIRILPA